MENKIKEAIIDVKDFPKPGIIFKDLTPVFGHPEVFSELINVFAERYKGKGITRIAGVESRGFVLGAPLAYKMGISFIPVRKPGKLPREVFSVEYELEYGTDKLEIHRDALEKGEKVLIIDDLLATGGTASATAKLIELAGGTVAEMAFIVELGFLNGREKLKGREVFAVVKY